MADSSIGGVLSVSASVPTDKDANVTTGYPSLTWTEVGGVISISEMGDSAEDTAVALLKTGRIEHSIGTIDGGTMSVECKNIDADAGQTIIRNGMHNDTNHSFKFQDSSGAVYYKEGKLANGKYTPRSASSFEGYNFEALINTATVKA